MNPLRFAVAITLLGLTAACSGSERADIGPVEKTLAYEMLDLELRTSRAPLEPLGFVKTVIEEATDVARRVGRNPKTPAEALAVLQAIQFSLERHNFLQPADESDWPNTVGDAIKPLELSNEKLQRELSFPPNVLRRERFDEKKPYYFVDCDIGVALFISVAQRLGWDFRLVNVPKHSFLRWHLPDGTVVTWDWVTGSPANDPSPPSTPDLLANLVRRGVYGYGMNPTQARGYYLGLVALKLEESPEKMRMAQESVDLAANDSIVQNNYAWALATSDGARELASVAVSNALAALSATPSDGNRADTLACALAVNGDKRLAVAMEDFAMDHADSETQKESFRKNRERIEAGAQCQ